MKTVSKKAISRFPFFTVFSFHTMSFDSHSKEQQPQGQLLLLQRLDKIKGDWLNLDRVMTVYLSTAGWTVMSLPTQDSYHIHYFKVFSRFKMK